MEARSSETLHRKHKGARNELGAICWLMDQGYEVFRNVSQHGAIDIIAVKNGEPLYLDVKSGGSKASHEQVQRGICILHAIYDGTYEIIAPIANAGSNCPICQTPIPKGNTKKTYCSPVCVAAAYNDRHGITRTKRQQAHLGEGLACIECRGPINLLTRPQGRKYCSDRCGHKNQTRRMQQQRADKVAAAKERLALAVASASTPDTPCAAS